MLRYLSLVFLLFAFSSHALGGVRAYTYLPKSLQKQFKRLGFNTRGVSIFVQAIGRKTPLLQIQGNVPRNPASVIKLFTTAVALDKLGPGYIWDTEVYSDGTIENGHLPGDLYIKGYGDPFMTPELFWRFLRDIRQAGLRHIGGDLILDTTYFQPLVEDPSSFDGKPHRVYNVSPNALLVNFQSIRFNFEPEKSTRKIKITAFPSLDTVKIDNQIQGRAGPCGNWRRRIIMHVLPQPERDQVRFSGRYPFSCGARHYYRVVNNSRLYFEGLFRRLWTEQGGQLDGKVSLATVPAHAQGLYTNHSLPLGDLVRGINKYSNNVMTRQLLLTLGAEIIGPPGTAKKGKQVIEQWLRDHQLFSRKMVMDNGAGLSRKTRITARQLGRLLLTIYQKPIMPEFISSLPINAVDGTMGHRFMDADVQGHMHIKTGTLNYVRSMAGYILSRDGTRYVVVMLHNHPRAHTGRGERLQDVILKWVYEAG